MQIIQNAVDIIAFITSPGTFLLYTNSVYNKGKTLLYGATTEY